MGRALDIWNAGTAGGGWRVTDHAVVIGRQIGTAGRALEHLRWGAGLHDIGKLAIPDHALLKLGKLDAGERELMKTHTKQGAAFLEPIAHLGPAIEVPPYHHEG